MKCFIAVMSVSIVTLLLAIVYLIHDGFIFVSKSSFTDYIQAGSGVLTFIGGAASVIVAMLVSRKETRNRRNDLYRKRAMIVHYMYDSLCSLDDALNMFVRDFEPFVKERKCYISDMIYNSHKSDVAEALSMLNEYKVTDMPDHQILLMFICVKKNLEKILEISSKLKEVHSEGLIHDDEYYSMMSYKLQRDFDEMVNAIDIVRNALERIKDFLKIN
ncbi:hypothetical protein AAEL24_000288 [Serratia marcescens]